jgi:hypothetical protein
VDVVKDKPAALPCDKRICWIVGGSKDSVSNVCDKALNMRESCCDAKSDAKTGRQAPEEVVHSRAEAQ